MQVGNLTILCDDESRFRHNCNGYMISFTNSAPVPLLRKYLGTMYNGFIHPKQVHEMVHISPAYSIRDLGTLVNHLGRQVEFTVLSGLAGC